MAGFIHAGGQTRQCPAAGVRQTQLRTERSQDKCDGPHEDDKLLTCDSLSSL